MEAHGLRGPVTKWQFRVAQMRAVLSNGLKDNPGIYGYQRRKRKSQ